MSCHNIGRGLNSVTEVVMELFFSGKISEEAMKKLVTACRKGVHWCDGNETEAIECIRDNYCGSCLKKMNEGEELFSIWDISFKAYRECKIRKLDDEGLISDRLCVDCFDKLLAKKSGEKDLGSIEREQIKQDYGEEHWKVFD